MILALVCLLPYVVFAVAILLVVLRREPPERPLPTSRALDAFVRQAREDRVRESAATVRRWRETESSTPLPRGSA